ncbi:fibronectin type III domain-containing protein [uncultured Nocardioides sp.]|uniref:fibronectin type III domain-containing protein n=1 Tax=uncultured Nocardioides sp. TaxID=198441 RepID=UPI000C52BE50|nr:hypothetical protein [Nocardioides sp.]
MSPSGSRVARSALSTVLLTTALALGVSSAPSISAPAPDGPSATGARDAITVIVDPVRQGPDAPAYNRAAARGAPLQRSDPFTLHSRPGSQRTIYLDFKGFRVAGTIWNDPPNGFGQPEPLPEAFYGGWSLDGDPNTYSALEADFIREVFAIVAEDFAPFDVDVTTEDPGQAAITRSGSGDQAFGTRALVTSSDVALNALCGGACSGVAILDAFDAPGEHAALQPAFIFSQTQSSQTPRPIAETISHEVGHNFGLGHDGKGAEPYYEGHGIWAPIMGFSDFRPVSHWSDGAYSGSTSTQDDLALIAANGAPLVADEAGSTVATAASSVPSAGALITSRSDKDVFALGTCTGPVAVTASAAPVSPNLDIRLDLLDSAGTVLDTDDPASDFGDGSTAGGMGAAVSIDEGAGRALFARVDGVGTGSVNTGYDDYASIGRYTLDVTCSGGTTADVPGQVSGLSASSAAPTTATATWSAPADDGGSSITGYRVSLVGGGSTLVPAGTTSHTFTGLSPETTYTVQVAAVNGEGDGATSSTQVTTQAAEVVEPTDPLAGPKIKKGFYNRKGTKLTLKWKPVDDAAGYIVVFTKRSGRVTDSFDQGQRTKGRIAMRKVSRRARFVLMVAYDLDGNIGDIGKRWRL